MSAKIIFRTMSFLLSLLPAMTGGFMPKDSRDPCDRKSKNEELPDRTFEEAGKLAAYYSKGRQAPKVEIDYTQKKNLRKPTGGKPGFVVYYTNYSLLIEPDITGLQQIQ